VIYLLTINYYSSNLIRQLLESLKITNYNNYQVVVVNNSPKDQDLKQLLKYPQVHIIEVEENLGFAAGCNVGLDWIYRQNQEAIAWLINPDTYFLNDYLTVAEKFFLKYPEISILGTIIYTPDSEIWFAGGDFIPHLGVINCREYLGENSANSDYFFCDWVSGCSMLINLKNFPTFPQFDTNYFLYYEDFDFCRRYFNEGHKIAFTSQISLIHQPSSITNRNIINKLKYSTFSYLLTLKKYTHPLIFSFKLLRLIIYSIILLPIKPKTGFGKIIGVFLYFLSDFT
jgi:GT2 family glycosyltransferase